MWLRQSLWFAVLICALVGSLTAGWLIQVMGNYHYSFWYDWYGIGTHIERFGPQNRYIHGLESLSKDEHVRLFNEISVAVHHQGQGLEYIRFVSDGVSRPLLRHAEIVHLQDVANLIDVLLPAGLGMAVFAIIAGRGLLRRRVFPDWHRQGALLGGLAILLAAVLLLAGPKAVFYQLHVWIFPDNHQWFFYYQDSLMSTLMKAPVLFAGIGAAIAAGGILIYAALLGLLIVWQRRVMR